MNTLALSMNHVSWTSYAAKYDMLLQYNPYYQELHHEVMDHVKQWDLGINDTVADIGAGTGNYSISTAKAFPLAQVVHLDRDPGMNAVAKQKASESIISNISFRESSIDEVNFLPGSLKACLAIHSLYTFKEPTAVLKKIHGWLADGGLAIFVDPGRVVNVLDWQLAIGTRMILKHGLSTTLRVMREAREVSIQNRAISKLQANGTYWTHSTEGFLQTVRSAGFEVLDSGTAFRGISDWALVRKP